MLAPRLIFLVTVMLRKPDLLITRSSEFGISTVHFPKLESSPILFDNNPIWEKRLEKLILIAPQVKFHDLPLFRN